MTLQEAIMLRHSVRRYIHKPLSAEIIETLRTKIEECNAEGMWNAGLVMTQCISIPFLIAGMAAGSVLVKRMSQEIFMKLTYILLFISGILLMVK